MAFICGYLLIERNPRVCERFERERKPFLIIVWVILQEEGDQGKRELNRVLFYGFQSLGTSYCGTYSILLQFWC